MTKMSKVKGLSKSFIEKFQDRMNWHWISRYQKLSESFIEKFHDRVNWKDISEYQKLSELCIEKFQQRVDWFEFSFSCNVVLSMSFYERYANALN